MEEDSQFIGGSLNIPKKEFETFIKKIQHDIDEANKYKGKGTFGLVVLPTYTFLVRIGVDVSWLNEWNAHSLCIDINQKIIIEIEFNYNYLESTTEPKLSKYSVYQSKEKDLSQSEIKTKNLDFGVIRWYLNNRLSTALRKFWINKNKILESKVKIEDKKILMTKTVDLTTKYKKEISNLNNMGFSIQQAYYALKKTKGNQEEAVNILLEDSLQFESLPDPKYSTSDDSNLWETFNKKIDIGKFENFLEKGNLFVGILEFLSYKISNCSSTCIICDSKLGYDGMKPTVCEKELCVHSLEEYGLGVDIYAELQHNISVIDLLVNLTYSAAQLCLETNGVREVSPSPKKLLGKMEHIDEGKAILDILDKLPKISEIKSKSNDKLSFKKYLDKKNDKLFPMLSWIITSNRAHLASVPKDQSIKGLPKEITPFVLISANPEREAQFRAKRKKYGSFYAFHGSSTGNWHCILRSGLKNYSGTNKMSAGQAYGPGIYLAKAMSTSLGYMRPSNKYWANSDLGSLMCMALCEVINDSSAYKGFDWGFVVTDETILTTRYLLIFTNQNYGLNCDASQLGVPKQLYE